MPVEFSIVIGSKNAWPSLRNCLASVAQFADPAVCEIIVAAWPPADAGEREAFPFAKFVSAPDSTDPNLADLRGVALAGTSADWVFLTEPFCTFPGDFVSRLRDARDLDADVVGGTVEMGEGLSVAAWATAFFEYGQFFPPLSADWTDEITSNNVLYRAEVLEPRSQWARTPFWKFFFHERLGAAGRRFMVQPERSVTHHPPYGFTEFMRRTLHHSRTYGATRFAEEPMPSRLGAILKTPVVPFVLAGRVWGRCIAKRRFRGQLIQAMPVIFAYDVAWAAGELAGALLGPGGSERHVY